METNKTHEEKKQNLSFEKLRKDAKNILLTVFLATSPLISTYAQDTKESPNMNRSQTEQIDPSKIPTLHTTVIVKGQEINIESSYDWTMKLHGFDFHGLPKEFVMWEITWDIKSVSEWHEAYKTKMSSSKKLSQDNEKQWEILKNALIRVSLELAKRDWHIKAKVVLINQNGEQYIQLHFEERY